MLSEKAAIPETMVEERDVAMGRQEGTRPDLQGGGRDAAIETLLVSRAPEAVRLAAFILRDPVTAQDVV